MDGRVYTLEDEIDVLHEDLGRLRRMLINMERAESDGRVTHPSLWRHNMRQCRLKITVLERELAEAYAEKIADAEWFQA